ncbi:potassium channel family protein [Natronoarchaeum rubrum]|uniref:potassium channel family protein n=1 Tax=Natronoarchaeum rubrum TaxID=755311 RepID=UPI002112BC02|nr:TrkA C-terminal domain-containing protein [Natronoarchaeum rubrum]
MGPYEGDVPSESIDYEPVSVKDVLVEMKDTSELLIDLSYSAVLHGSEAVAREVLTLEEKMGVLQMRARMSLMMAARNPTDTERLAPVLGVVGGAQKISDAAGDVAKIVIEEMGLPEAMRAAIPEAVEMLVRGSVARDSDFAGRTLEDVNLESRTGVRVIAIRRGPEWILNPGPETTVEPADVVILRGPDQSIAEVYETYTGEAYEPPEVDEPGVADLDRAVDSIVHMKNLSELAVDLAYSSILFDNVELAKEVRNLEVEVDALQSRFEAWTLRAAADADDPVVLRGLIRLGIATEVISDAALEISEGVLRDIEVHPVVELAVKESDEIISRVEIAPGSPLVGTDVVEGIPDTEVSMSVIAIRRPDEGWLLVADSETELVAGDVLIAKGTRTSAETFEKLANA